MKSDGLDEQRRAFLVKALTAGALTLGSSVLTTPLLAMGKIPKEIPPGKSIFDMSGDVKVNNKRATLDTFINPGDTVITGDNSHVVFVVAKDAFVLRSNSHMKTEGETTLKDILLKAGKMLTVFSHRLGPEKLKVRSYVATAGVRGTGLYMEADPEKTYLCTCYGEVEIVSNTDRNVRQVVTATHHDEPKYILEKPSAGKLILPAPFINHDDDELILIEELVGRTVPFGLETDGYKGPRKDY